MYHSLSRNVEFPWLQVSPRSLGRQLDLMTELGYHLVPLDEALRCPGENVAAVTFDDGLSDFLGAVEILRERKVRATLFVCPGLVGGESAWARSPELHHRPLLGPEAISSLARQGVDIGCHGWTHRSFLELSSGHLAENLDRCRTWFRARLGVEAQYLAYPYGACDAERAEVVGKYFSQALAVEPLPDVPRPLAVPRLCMVDGMSREHLQEQLCRQDLEIGLFPSP